MKDRFGDHGLVGVVIMEKKSEDELFIDTWLMSCRVLKRSMEEFVVNKLIERAENSGFSKITAEYIPTSKNMMVKNIYKTMGFKECSENQYCIEVGEYQSKKTFIMEEC